MIRRLFLASCLLGALPTLASGFDTDEMVAAHNRWRKTVGVPPLVYSQDLAASAQAWADHLKQDNRCRMQHSQPDRRYGENLFWASALEWSNGKRDLQMIGPDAVVDDWAGERANYDYKNNRCARGKMCGHYTQLVWRTSTTVGCAVAVCEDTREQVWVCQYQPPGNWAGKRPY